MSQRIWEHELRWVEEAGYSLASGLSATELSIVEKMHGFTFPPDLRSLLTTAMPVGKGFPDWRHPDSKVIIDQLNWPAEGIAFDVEQNGIWFDEWGDKPNDPKAAAAFARRLVSDAPVLIPLFGHRYIPSEPCEAGNPVFSVYQTDIIYYGLDLHSYLAAEFHPIPNEDGAAVQPKAIRFWSNLVE